VTDAPLLEGSFVRLEPLERTHIAALVSAAQGEEELFRWTTVPTTVADMTRYVGTALRWREEGTAQPLVTVRRSDAAVVGSTRFFLIERWPWPESEAAAHPGPDGCEIGYTWLNSGAVRTPINTEAKLLMLRHAFEAWGMQRVCFHTDARNERSRNALLRIGARFEGVLRSHRLSADLKPRDSARYSVLAGEWPVVRERLERRLAAPQSP
jgi:RimJ/RimL family protein N-acetyltransferase